VKSPEIVDIYNKKVEIFCVLNFANCEKLLVKKFQRIPSNKSLFLLDIKVNSVSESGLGLTIPSYR
jgi:phenylalanyl-tRNA synthetase beta chain